MSNEVMAGGHDLWPWVLAKLDTRLRGLASPIFVTVMLGLWVGKVVIDTGSFRPLVPVSVLASVIIIGAWVIRWMAAGTRGSDGDSPDEADELDVADEPQPWAASADPWAEFQAKQEAMQAEMEAKAPGR